MKQQEELNKVEIEQLKEELEHLKECVGEHEAELQKEQEHVTTLETRITELKVHKCISLFIRGLNLSRG